MILMSSMIAELSRYQFPQIGKGKENEPEDAFARTGYVRDHEQLKWEGRKTDTRFPSTHKSESVDFADFHRLKVLPSKNHSAVPLCRALHAVL
jgi:hypothetical protein